MKLWIFDVEHGSCACAFTDQGQTILFDCGTNSTTGFTPTRWLKDRGVTDIHLVISHFDHDHLSDLPSLVASSLRVRSITRNKSRSAAAIRADKIATGGVSAAVDAALRLHERYTTPITTESENYIRELATNANTAADFNDQNNLSLVAFLTYPGLNIVFPGDLERAGWLRLLRNAQFCQRINALDFLVAPHHGRESGFAAEIFLRGVPKPDLVLVSDGKIRHDSQPIDRYRPYARGMTFGSTIRYVLTTRRDGNLRLDAPGDGTCTVTMQAAI